MAKPKKATFWIRTRGDDGADTFEEVDGYVLGDFGTHRADGYGGKRWDITHLPTGYAISRGVVYWKKDDAFKELVWRAENGLEPGDQCIIDKATRSPWGGKINGLAGLQAVFGFVDDD